MQGRRSLHRLRDAWENGAAPRNGASAGSGVLRRLESPALAGRRFVVIAALNPTNPRQRGVAETPLELGGV
jgi:hypothetical protein